MPAVERRLSPDLLAKAVRSGEEYGWRFEDLPTVLAQAREAGLAVLGGQVQFKLPDGTCELYWQNADATDRRDGEAWKAYVDRPHDEVQAALERLPTTELILREGLERFAFLRERAAEGVDLRRFLCFICYFEAEHA